MCVCIKLFEKKNDTSCLVNRWQHMRPKRGKTWYNAAEVEVATWKTQEANRTHDVQLNKPK